MKVRVEEKTEMEVQGAGKKKALVVIVSEETGVRVLWTETDVIPPQDTPSKYIDSDLKSFYIDFDFRHLFCAIL